MLFQIRRAFNNTFQHIIGSSPPVIEMRANVWRSIFTHDVRRYLKTMYGAMSDFPTLITGPTGSGKELVARAIGLSGFVPFDVAKGEFASPLNRLFTSLNLSALSQTLIESELFGHKKGAFTGATSDRIGWLEACPAHGAVFLDEIGELDHDVQVKLLRVAQDRVFQRLGDTEPRHFKGRIIAATNRDLAEEIQAGRFRTDFYYRLCADQIQTPSLCERYCADQSELAHLVEHLLTRIVGSEGPTLAAEFLPWVQEKLGSDYQWPGNVRELDQCIRSWLIRQDYQPCGIPNATTDSRDLDLAVVLAKSKMTAEELVAFYCQTKYRETGSYVETANQLGLDRRTVKAKVSSLEESNDN
jgi:DNA-binding NtrC family response regulator